MMTEERRDFIRGVIERRAKMLEESGAIDKKIMPCLSGADEKETEIWRAAVPYLLAMALSLREFHSNNVAQHAIMEAADGAFIWEKVKHLYPEIENDDLGAVLIGADLIERFIIYGELYKKGEGTGKADVKEADISEKERPVIKAVAKRTKDFASELTKIGKTIFDPANAQDVFSENGIAVTTGTRRGQPVQAFVTVNYDELPKEGVNIPSWGKLTSYDREILSIVSSLYDAGNEYQSTDLIGRALAGYRNDAALTPRQREKIINALRVLRSVQITINSTQEYKARYNTQAHYEGALLPSERIEIMELNGQKVRDCVHIFRASPLYEYAKSKKQLARVDIKMLDAPINLTEENIILRGYLIRQVSSMKSSKSNIRPVILYDTLYEMLELEAKGYSVQELRDKKKKVRDTAKRILEYWAGEGFIQGVNEVSEGRKITKINITI